MNFQQLIAARQSCRNFDPEKPVSQEEVTACLKAAQLAPSACNSQPWQFTVCSGELAKQVAATTQSMGMNKFTSQAPWLIVISEGNYNAQAASGSKLKHQDFRSIDIGIATAHLTLAATDRGLSTCILGWFNEKQLQQLLSLKSHIRLVIALGYAKEEDPLRQKKRKDLSQIADFRK